MKKELYVYVHIPFCFKKCPYCAFVSFEKRFHLLRKYVERLIEEISALDCNGCVAKTIYFGGGTPNTLKIKDFESILNAVSKKFELSLEEVTVELTPKPLKLEYLKDLRSLGINRISLGVQSFLSDKLKALGRIHSVEDSIRSIELVHMAGFENVSIDLIYGIADSTSSIKKELKIASSCPIKHVSAYGLTIEEHTPFFDLHRRNMLDVSSDDEYLALYETICEILDKSGFKQYEISNFAKEGFRARHNLAYWVGKEYVGFGVSAASFLNNTRFKNTSDFFEYLKDPSSSKIAEEVLGDEERAKEMFILGMRLREGVNVKNFKENYNFDIWQHYGEKLEFFIKSGLMAFDGSNLRLNGCRAMYVSNSILCEFL